MNSNGTRWENDSMCYTKVTSDNKDRNKEFEQGFKTGKVTEEKMLRTEYLF